MVKNNKIVNKSLWVWAKLRTMDYYSLILKHKLITILSLIILIIICNKLLKPLFLAKFSPTKLLVVTVEKVQQKTVEVKLNATGRVIPIQEISVRSQVDGILLNTGFQEGELIKKDQLLFEIDPLTLQARYNQALANSDQVKADLDRAHLQLDQYTKLYEKKFVSDQEYQQILANVKMLVASWEATKAALEAAKLHLERTKIYSPITGYAGQILIHPGNLVQANNLEPLVKINQIHPIHVVFNLPEKYLAEIPKNIRSLDQLKIKLTNLPIQGKLVFFDNKVDQLTGTILLKAQFPNADLKLWPGKLVNLNVAIKTLPAALLVPNRAIQIGQQGSYVYIAEKLKNPSNKGKISYTIAKVRKVLVTVGPILEEQTVIEAGLEPETFVITEGHSHLIDQAMVKFHEH